MISRHTYIDVNLMHPVTGPSCTWEDWKKKRSGGFFGFIKYILASGTITLKEYLDLIHEDLLQEGKCHKYNRIPYCFCGKES